MGNHKSYQDFTILIPFDSFRAADGGKTRVIMELSAEKVEEPFAHYVVGSLRGDHIIINPLPGVIA